MNIKIFLFDERNMRGKGIVNIVDNIDNKLMISTRIGNHIFNKNDMGFITAVASDSSDSNAMSSVKEINISFIVTVEMPGMTVALRAFDFIEIDGINNIIIGILSQILDFFV